MKFGIIGTGWITETYIDGALDSGLWEFTAIYSRTTETGLAFGKKYGVTQIFTSVDDMAASDLDAVYVASPNALHFKQCSALLKAKKHVICEKPLTAQAHKAKALYDLAEENGVVFLEAIMYLHLPGRAVLQNALTKIGQIHLATFDFCQRSSKYDSYLAGALPNIFNPALETGALMDLGVYCLYPALDLFGLPDSFTAETLMLKSGADALGLITLHYSDKLVCLRYSKIGQAGADSDIQGDSGSLSIASISRLAGIDLVYADGKKEHLCDDKEKFKLMGYEAKDFYRYITDPRGTREEYAHCKNLSLQVSELMEQIRRAGGIAFPSDKA